MSTNQRAVIYLRQSLDPTGEAAGVARQREACERLCRDRGWSVVAVEEDNSISAYAGKPRPGWDRVLAMAEGRRVDVVVAWHVDRLTRSMVDLERLIKICMDADVSVATASGDFDMTSDAGRMLARILGTVARGESERKAARQRLANAQRVKAGKVGPGPRPLGLRRENGSYVILEHEAEAVREGAETLLLGGTLADVARDWNRRGFRTSQGGREWRRDAVRKALLSPRYVGTLTHNGVPVLEDAFPAILPPETHAAVVALLTNPARRLTTFAGQGAANLLTGIAHCECGAHVNASANGARLTYKCSERSHMALPRHEVDARVTVKVLARLERDDAADLLRRDGRDTKELRDEASALRRRLDVLTAAFVDGTITEGQLRAGTARLRGRITEAEAAMADAGRANIFAGLIGAEDVRAAWLDEAFPLNRRRAVVETLCRVTLHPPGRGARTFKPSTVEVELLA